MSQELICLSDVTIRREKGDNIFDLSISDLTVKSGEYIAVVGPSGCGKSTLLDILALVLKPDNAAAFKMNLNGKQDDVMGMSESELAGLRMSRLGYVLQTGGLLPFLTVKENILLPKWINGSDQAEAGLEPLVTRLGIADQLNKKPQHLSGGQRQRVAIARALFHQPKIVLADEPTAAVDKYTAREIVAIFKELTMEMQAGLIMVTHDQNLIKGVVDRVFGFEMKKDNPLTTFSSCVEMNVENPIDD